MKTGTLISLALGAVSVACAAGAFEPRPTVTVDPDDSGDGSMHIAGLIRDSKTDEALENALVIVQCTCLQGARETQTNSVGAYAFRDLPPGTYTVQVLYGQADVSKVVTLERGASMRVNMRMHDTPHVVT